MFAHGRVSRGSAMSELSAAERAYRRLKADLLDGRIPNGRLDIGRLADRMTLSVTPIREALARLHAERLVRLSPQLGYAAVYPPPRQLTQLYELSGLLLDAGLARMRRRRSSTPVACAGMQDYATRMAELIANIASAFVNRELADQTMAVSERLHVARRSEPDLFKNADRDADNLWRQWSAGLPADLRAQFRAYHRSRAVCAGQIAMLIADQTSILPGEVDASPR